MNLTPQEKETKNKAIAAGRYAHVAVIRPQGDYGIGIAIEGIKGYFPTDYHGVPTYQKASEWAKLINARREDITPEEATQIVISTMAGSSDDIDAPPAPPQAQR